MKQGAEKIRGFSRGATELRGRTWWNRYRAEAVDPATIGTGSSRLRQILRAAWGEGFAAHVIERGSIRLPSASRAEQGRRQIDALELDQILEATDGPQRALFAILGLLAARIAEAHAVEWHDVDLAVGVLRIRQAGACEASAPTRTRSVRRDMPSPTQLQALPAEYRAEVPHGTGLTVHAREARPMRTDDAQARHRHPSSAILREQFTAARRCAQHTAPVAALFRRPRQKSDLCVHRGAQVLQFKASQKCSAPAGSIAACDQNSLLEPVLASRLPAVRDVTVSAGAHRGPLRSGGTYRNPEISMLIDPRKLYRQLAARYRKLSAAAPRQLRGVSTIGGRHAPKAAKRTAQPLSNRSERPRRTTPPAQRSPLDAIHAERARLKVAFDLAHARGQVATAVALLQGDASARQIEVAIAALPIQPRTSGLAARMAELPSIEIGSVPSGRDAMATAGGPAAQLKSAYNRALGTSER